MVTTTQREEERQVQLELARLLVEQLEQGDDEGVDITIHRLSAPFERELFAELGKLTRDLHEALKGFREDSRLLEITRDEIPDAKERLNYVITMTEQATHRTLNAVDAGLPIAEQIHAMAADLAANWVRFRRREMSVDQFRQLANELDAFFAMTDTETERLRSLMSEIMMAQDFQDLTGQIISRVIRLVQDVEENLVGLVRLSSARMESMKSAATRPSAEDEAAAAIESRGPAVPNTKDIQANVVSGQDDVDDLLSSLGF